MLFHFLVPLSESMAVFNVFRYITFRAAGAATTALVLSLVLGPVLIRTLQRLSIGQNIRDEGPKSHQAKAGTPTMGGVLILVALTVPTLLWARLDNPFVWLVIATTLAFGSIGFADDYLKLHRENDKGLTAWFKFTLTCMVALSFGLLLVSLSFETTLTFPFFKDLVLNLGLFYLALVVAILVGTSHAVNLTDGLDGLAIGATLVAAATYAIFTYIAGNSIVADYLQVAFVPGAGEVSIFCAALVGASLGFLWFNCHPAEIFMGDTGSLAIGGAIGSVAILSKQEILLFVVGGLFVIEAVSVILQVGSFKLRGVRIFRMAPIHHHFELKGWREPQIIVRFWILAVLFALLSLATLKLR